MTQKMNDAQLGRLSLRDSEFMMVAFRSTKVASLGEAFAERSERRPTVRIKCHSLIKLVIRSVCDFLVNPVL